MTIGWMFGVHPGGNRAIAWNVESGEYQLCQGTSGPTVSDIRLDPRVQYESPYPQEVQYGLMQLWLKYAQMLLELQNRNPRPMPPVNPPPANPQQPNRLNGPVGRLRVSAEGSYPPMYLRASGSSSGAKSTQGSATYTKTSGDDWSVAHKVGDGNWVMVFGDGGSGPMNLAVTFAQRYGDGLRGASTFTYNNDGHTPVFPYPAYGVMAGINFTIAQDDPVQSDWNNPNWSQV